MVVPRAWRRVLSAPSSLSFPYAGSQPSQSKKDAARRISLPTIHSRRTAMADLVFLVLGLGTLIAFAFYARLLARLS